MTLDDFMPFVLPRASGCPEITVAFNVRLALIELCRESLMWRDYQPAITTVAGQTAYVYTPASSEQKVCKLIGMTLGGQEVPVIDPTAGKRRDLLGTQQVYAYGNMTGFELRPAQGAGLSLVTYSALVPSMTATSVPDSFERYMEQVANGALYRLSSSTGMKWSNKASAQDYYLLWQEAIAGARSDVFSGFSRTTQRTAPSRF